MVCMCENEIYRCFILFSIRRNFTHILYDATSINRRGCCCYMRSKWRLCVANFDDIRSNASVDTKFKRLIHTTVRYKMILFAKCADLMASNVRATYFIVMVGNGQIIQDILKRTKKNAFQTNDKAITYSKTEGLPHQFFDHFPRWNCLPIYSVRLFLATRPTELNFHH